MDIKVTNNLSSDVEFKMGVFYEVFKDDMLSQRYYSTGTINLLKLMAPSFSFEKDGMTGCWICCWTDCWIV